MASHEHLDDGGTERPPDEGAEVLAAGDLLVEGPHGGVQAAQQKFPLRLHLLVQPGGGGGEKAVLCPGAEVLQDGDDVLHGPLRVRPAEPSAQAGHSVGRDVLGSRPGGGAGGGAEDVLAQRHQLEGDVTRHHPAAVTGERQHGLQAQREIRSLLNVQKISFCLDN